MAFFYLQLMPIYFPIIDELYLVIKINAREKKQIGFITNSPYKSIKKFSLQKKGFSVAVYLNCLQDYVFL